MAFRRRSGSSWVTPNRIQRRSGSSWVDVDRIYRRSGSSWIMVYQSYQPLTVRATPILASTDYPGTLAERPTVTVSGGKGTITYKWTAIDPAPGVTLSSTTIINPIFRKSTIGLSLGIYRITVSDGISSAYADISVNMMIRSIDGPGGPLQPV